MASTFRLNLFARRFLPLALLVATAGCSTQPAPLARVGSSSITVATFEEVARTAAARFPGPPEEAKARLLDYLVNRELLVLEGRRSKVVPDSMEQRFRRQAEDRALGQALIERLVPHGTEPPVSDAELARFYEWRKVGARCRLVYTYNRARAEAALAALRRGEPFEAVSDRFSLPGVLPPGGQLGYMIAGTMFDPLDQVIRTAPIGKVIGPLESPRQGWFLVEVQERKEQPQAPFDEEADQLREMLRQRKQQAAAARAVTALRLAYRIQTRPEGVEAFFRQGNSSSQVESMGGESLPREASSEERRIVLGTHDDVAGRPVAYTLGEAMDDLAGGTEDRPTPGMLPSFEQWVQAQLVRRATTAESKRRSLHQEPVMARAIEEQVKDQIVNVVYQAEVVSQAQPTEADTRAAFESHAAQLRSVESADVNLVVVRDSVLAYRIAEGVSGGRPLAQVVAEIGGELPVQSLRVTYPTPNPLWNSMRMLFQNAQPGQLLGPIPLSDGMLLLQLVNKQESQARFETLPPGLQENLRNEGQRFAYERRLTEVTGRLKRDFPVTVDPAGLRKASWPAQDPMQMFGGGSMQAP